MLRVLLIATAFQHLAIARKRAIPVTFGATTINEGMWAIGVAVDQVGAFRTQTRHVRGIGEEITVAFDT
jgi:hypothetical protein